MNEFNVMFQGGESMIGYLHTEMTRLLRKLMGRFTTTEVIRDATDLPKVPFQVRENQHDDERLAVGWRVREYLDNSDVSTEITKKFFSDVRVFYEKMVATMVAKFPFKDATLQSLSFLKPDLRDTIKALKFILSCRIF
ncbi:uncharacterized protein LOC128553963 [Mercenaria mercenaria]|uniref:uncharacterized protein LOC128553963 n=1 Tax=Mercenaria mercenaria TaxID=6596 RepID=UPI00234E7EFA|nr:uncharacterized protein LOC128553963 [Mercenaria mercenaria]